MGRATFPSWCFNSFYNRGRVALLCFLCGLIKYKWNEAFQDMPAKGRGYKTETNINYCTLFSVGFEWRGVDFAFGKDHNDCANCSCSTTLIWDNREEGLAITQKKVLHEKECQEKKKRAKRAKQKKHVKQIEKNSYRTWRWKKHSVQKKSPLLPSLKI